MYTCRAQFTPHHLLHCSLSSLLLMLHILRSVSLRSLPQPPSSSYFLPPGVPSGRVWCVADWDRDLNAACGERDTRASAGPWWGWENHHPPSSPSPSPRPRWLPHLATSQQYRTPANWFHVGPHWAGIKVCKGWPHHSHTHTVHTESR